MGDVLKIPDEYRQIQWADQQGILYPTRTFRKELLYLGKSPSHEELEAFMPWAPDVQEDCKIPNTDAYTNTYLE